MNPVLFSLGDRPVYIYTFVVGVFLAAALAWVAWQDRRQRDGRLDAAIFALAVGLIGARIVHILANWPYYAERPREIIALTDGGLSFHGGLLIGSAALAGLVVWRSRRNRQRAALASLAAVIAALAVPLAIGLLGGWLGCLLAGCAYGQDVPPPQRFYTPDWPDLYGVHAFRLPSQALGLALAALLLVVALLFSQRPGIWLILLGVGDFLIAGTRGDLTVTWGPLLATQWADLALVLAGLILELRGRKRAAQPQAGDEHAPEIP